MSRWHDSEAEKIGGPNLDPFWHTRRGKAILLSVFLGSIAAGVGIGYALRLFGWRRSAGVSVEPIVIPF
jgi:hypothetical protein